MRFWTPDIAGAHDRVRLAQWGEILKIELGLVGVLASHERDAQACGPQVAHRLDRGTEQSNPLVVMLKALERELNARVQPARIAIGQAEQVHLLGQRHPDQRLNGRIGGAIAREALVSVAESGDDRADGIGQGAIDIEQDSLLALGERRAHHVAGLWQIGPRRNPLILSVPHADHQGCPRSGTEIHVRIEPTFLTLMGGVEPAQPSGVTPEGFEEMLALFWGEGASPPRGSPPPVPLAGAEEASPIQPNAEGHPPDLPPIELELPALDGDTEFPDPLPPLDVVFAGIFATAPNPLATPAAPPVDLSTGMIAGLASTPAGPAPTWRLAPPPEAAPSLEGSPKSFPVDGQPPRPPSAPSAPETGSATPADEVEAIRTPATALPMHEPDAMTHVEIVAPTPTVGEALAARRPEVMAVAVPAPKGRARTTEEAGGPAPAPAPVLATGTGAPPKPDAAPEPDAAPTTLEPPAATTLLVEARKGQAPEVAQSPSGEIEVAPGLPQADASKNAGPSGQAPPPPPPQVPSSSPAEPARAVAPDTASRAIQTVVDRIETLAAQRPRGTVVVRLDPPELGTVTLTIHQFGPRFDADIAASNDGLRAALEQSRGQLGQAIEQKGLQLGALRFEAPAPSPGFGQPHHGAPDHTAHQDSTRLQNLVRDPEPNASLADWRPLAADGLDLRL